MCAKKQTRFVLTSPTSSQTRFDLTLDTFRFCDYIGVYEIDRVDTLPLCNGIPFTEGFLPEFLRRFHPEKSDDNPYKFSVRFVIDKNGNLVGPRVKTPSSEFYKSSDKQLSAYEKHVLETVNQIQNWEPGKVDGTPVNVILTVPVIF